MPYGIPWRWLAETESTNDVAREWALLGAPGGAWIGVALSQVLVNLLDFGMGIQEAVLAPRISATSETLDLSLRIPRATEAARRDHARRRRSRRRDEGLRSPRAR